jgi:hypothetical protein
MQNRSVLLGGAALGVLLAAGFGAQAQAKTTHHHHMAAAHDSATEEKIDSLTAAVGTLEQRLNDETAAQQATEARAQAAEAKADAAEADAQAARGQLQDQIQTIPGEVQSAVAANTPKPKPSWTDGTKVGGTVFVDLSDISQTPTPNKINGVGADIKRAYVSIDHSFNSIYSANLTLDFAPNGIILNGGTFGTGTLMGSEAVKYAYAQAHYDDALIIQVGAEKTPWIPFVEDLYGYRFIDKVVVDQNKYGNSSDWGANVHGDFGHGLVDYSLSVVDGDGYKTPERSQTMDFEGRANVNYMGFVAAVGGYVGDLGDDFQGNAAPHQQVSPEDALLYYSNSQFKIGGEWFQANDWKTPQGTAAAAAVAATTLTGPCTVGVTQTCTITTAPAVAAKAAVPAAQDQTQGWSFFGAYNVTPEWSVFARYDFLNPSEKLDPMERYEYADVGVNYEPVKTLDLALVYKHEDVNHAIKGGYTDGTTTLAPNSTGAFNAKTGAFTGTLTSASFDEVGLYVQYKF